MPHRTLTIEVALGLVAIWIALTVGVEFAVSGPGAQIDERAATGPLVGVSIAAAFLLIAVLAGGRGETVGLLRPQPGTLRLALPAALAVAVMAAIALAEGLPPMSILSLLVLNTALVGFSEELAFRGVLLTGLRTVLGTGRAVVVAAVIFGGVHSLNGLLTGDPGSAIAQSVLAVGMGIWTAGLRLRTGSLLAPILLHAAWDFALIAALVGGSGAAAVGVSLVSLLAIALLTAHGARLVRAQLAHEQAAAGSSGVAERVSAAA